LTAQSIYRTIIHNYNYNQQARDVLFQNRKSIAKFGGGGKIGKAWDDPYLTCLARRCSILFSTLMFMHVVSDILTRNERHFAVDSETVCLWLVDHSYDRTIKTLC